MKSHDLERLRAALRRGDPAADGREPDAAETRLLRERLLEAAAEAGPDRAPGTPTPSSGRPAVAAPTDPSGRARAAWLRPAFATAAAAATALILVLGVVLAFGPGRALDRVADRLRGAAGPEEAPAGAAVPAEAEPPHRQVQFTTPGGTRIVWVLYPE